MEMYDVCSVKNCDCVCVSDNDSITIVLWRHVFVSAFLFAVDVVTDSVSVLFFLATIFLYSTRFELELGAEKKKAKNICLPSVVITLTDWRTDDDYYLFHLFIISHVDWLYSYTHNCCVLLCLGSSFQIVVDQLPIG